MEVKEHKITSLSQKLENMLKFNEVLSQENQGLFELIKRFNEKIQPLALDLQLDTYHSKAIINYYLKKFLD